MKKRIIKVITLILMFYIPNVYAGEFYLCSYVGPLKAFKIAGTVIYVSKIIAPLIIIVMASIGFGKALISGDEKDLKEEASKLIKRFIAGIVIFFIPTIIGLVLGFVSNYNETVSNYVDCNTCLFHPFSETCTGKISLSSEYTSDKKVDVTINPYHTTGGLSGDDDDKGSGSGSQVTVSSGVCTGNEISFTSDVKQYSLSSLTCSVMYGNARWQSLDINPYISDEMLKALEKTCSIINEYSDFYQIDYLMTAGTHSDGNGIDYPHKYAMGIDIFNNWKYSFTDSNGNEIEYAPYAQYGEGAWAAYKQFVCNVCDGQEDCKENLNYQLYKDVFKPLGFCWGGNWNSSIFDPMHFEYSRCKNYDCYVVSKEFNCD